MFIPSTLLIKHLMSYLRVIWNLRQTSHPPSLPAHTKYTLFGLVADSEFYLRQIYRYFGIFTHLKRRNNASHFGHKP